MSGFALTPGFEDVWRPPVRQRLVRPTSVLSSNRRRDPYTTLKRLVERAPEVMVKLTGKTRDGAHLKAHLDYISRNGGLELEGPHGVIHAGREELRDLASDWALAAEMDPRRRAGTPVSRSLVLSMPAGTDPLALRDAARVFAADLFAASHDYAFTLHTDTPRPHVHLSVCSRGHSGERLNPKKADLELWRQVFAQALRDRGVAAEATPRRARGVTRKPDRTAVRKLLDRHQAGAGEMPRVRRSAYSEAAAAAFQGDAAPRVWERRLLARQAAVRRLYLNQAELLAGSARPEDRDLAQKVRAFVAAMSVPDSQRLALARELRAANEAARRRTGPERQR